MFHTLCRRINLETKLTPKSLARYIDHTLLKAEAPEASYRKLCEEAQAFGFFSVCVPGIRIPLVKSLLETSHVKSVAVVGFPFGYCDPLTKAFEAAQAKKNGADEIDMVLQIGALKEGSYDIVLEDIAGVIAAAAGLPVKVILETGLLTDQEKRKACELSQEAGAQFVKTCSGFSPGQAEVSDIQLMKSIVGHRLQIKASGGIRDIAKAELLIQAGATRLGTSSGVALVQGLTTVGTDY